MRIAKEKKLRKNNIIFWKACCENQGITMVALIVTVIVMLVLAGVTLTLTLSDNGLFKTAASTKDIQKIAEYKERVEIARTNVGINNAGVITLDNLIEQIYKDKIVERGSITKLDDARAQMVTKEGYVFIITADTIEYIGTTDEIPTEGIVFENLIWSDGKASITVTTLAKEYTLQVSKDGKTWTPTSVDTSTRSRTITEISTGTIVYARLWNGNNFTTANISVLVEDTILPQDPNISFDKTTTATASDVIATVTLKDNESGVDIENSRWLYTTDANEIGTEDSKYEKTFTSNPQEITLNTTIPGTYYLHVLTKDNAGNKKETISKAITVNQYVTGISLDKTSTTITGYGNTENLVATITPDNATNKDVTWTSSNTSVATVSGGKITAVKAGSAIITVTTNDGSEKKATCQVTVKTGLKDLKAGDYVTYNSGTNGNIACRVLYPLSSSYGLQIISNVNVKNVTLGGSTFTAGRTSYNGAISTLNNEANAYLNTTYATSARCVGSNPSNKNAENTAIVTLQFTPYNWTTTNSGCKNSDNNYSTDVSAMKQANILKTGQEYWLASRTIGQSTTFADFYIRKVDTTEADTNGYALCSVNEALVEAGWTQTTGFRPCITLKNTLKVTGGDGTSSKPYTLGT